MTADVRQTTLGHALVACALILLHKAAGVSFAPEEVIVLQGGLGGALALLLPPLGGQG